MYAIYCKNKPNSEALTKELEQKSTFLRVCLIFEILQSLDLLITTICQNQCVSSCLTYLLCIFSVPAKKFFLYRNIGPQTYKKPFIEYKMKKKPFLKVGPEHIVNSSTRSLHSSLTITFCLIATPHKNFLFVEIHAPRSSSNISYTFVCWLYTVIKFAASHFRIFKQNWDINCLFILIC